MIDYANDTCYRLETNTDDVRQDLVPFKGKANYFEKICLRGETFYAFGDFNARGPFYDFFEFPKRFRSLY